MTELKKPDTKENGYISVFLYLQMETINVSINLFNKLYLSLKFDEIHRSSLESVWPYVTAERRRGRVVRAARLWCRKSPYRVSSRLGCAMRRLENSLCQPSRKWVPFSN